MNRLKTGGRQVGTPNRRTQEIESLLSSMGCDPIEGMAEVAQLAREANDLRLAGQMYKELAQYVAPKRRSIEVRTDQSANPIEQMKDEELDAVIQEVKETVRIIKEGVAAGESTEFIETEKAKLMLEVNDE